MGLGADATAINDVLITIGFKIENIKNAMKQQMSSLKLEAENIRNTMKKVATMDDNVVKSMFGGSKGQVMNAFKDELDNINDEMHNLKVNANKALTPLQEKFYKNKQKAKQYNTELKKTNREFAGWAMSIMFFGMAMKRVFDTAWKSGSRYFQDAMHSVEGTVTGFDMLQGAVSYLGFTIGQALEPVAQWLVPIILSIADWVSQNQELAATLVVALGVLGTIALLTGTLKLAWDGIAVASAKFASTKLGGPLVAFLSNPVVIAVVAALALLAALSWKAFKETPEAWRALKTTLKDLSEGPLRTIGTQINEMLMKMFNWQISWENIAWVIAWVVAVLSKMAEMGILGFVALVKTLAGVGGAFKALAMVAVETWNAIRGRGFAGRGILNQLKNSVGIVAKGLSDFLNSSSDLGDLMIQGPNGYKAMMLYRQQIEDAGGLTDWLAQGGISGNGPQSNQYNEINVTVGPDVAPQEVGQSILEAIEQNTFMNGG